MQHHSGALLAVLYRGLTQGFPARGQKTEVRLKRPTNGIYEIEMLELDGRRYKMRVGGFWSCEATIYLDNQRRVRMEHNHADTVEVCDIYHTDHRIDSGKAHSEDGNTYEFKTKRMDPTRVEFAAEDKQKRPETKEYEFVR